MNYESGVPSFELSLKLETRKLFLDDGYGKNNLQINDPWRGVLPVIRWT